MDTSLFLFFVANRRSSRILEFSFRVIAVLKLATFHFTERRAGVIGEFCEIWNLRAFLITSRGRDLSNQRTRLHVERRREGDVDTIAKLPAGEILGNQDKTLLFGKTRYTSTTGALSADGGIVTRMILLEGVKPQYAVILPGVHAEAIITHPFNVSRGARPRLQPVFSRVCLSLPTRNHLAPPTFSRTILRMASSRPGRITWLVAKRCTRVKGTGTCGKGAPEPI